MINEKELNLTQISPTKRDFYQIWTELLDVSKKLSNRWDPTSTNESDPGIVLLKVLTACTDKLNYNIDKSVLELFMPSVTQEDSMRKLCDMLGYNMKYYQSATTDVTISYKGDLLNNEKITTFTLPAFTQIQNDAGDINYTTLEPASFSVGNSATEVSVSAVSVPCIEGTYQVCSTNDGKLITIDHIDDNQRYYLPEAAVAENGIFVQNWIDTAYSQEWKKVDNLNTVPAGTYTWKFGFDSYRQMPYIQFPEDISSIIEDGLRIAYIRTTGINGNISARTLTKVAQIEISPSTTDSASDSNSQSITQDDFIVVNKNATVNGANIETINDAYNNYKKTIGTFDTLVTCRDYMNKIYNLYTDDNIPLVSNIIVSDIRDDLNRAVTLCSFNEYGICYIDKALMKEKEALINNFDLILYPFKTIYGINNKSEYISSFKPDTSTHGDIENALEDSKTISHIFKTVDSDEVACIKNYLKLSARITTTYKVNTIEENEILNNIYTNIYKNFNMRKMDFGEDIPYDTILACIEEADERIKNVSLDEPQIVTKFMLGDGSEYFMDSEKLASEPNRVKKAYNKLLFKNVLAGKVPLFNYDTSFKYGLTESSSTIYPNTSGSSSKISKVTKIETECLIDTAKGDIDKEKDTSKENPIKLTEGEVIQFRVPNYKTTITYPAYVNYFIKLSNTETTRAVVAEFETLPNFIADHYESEQIIADATDEMFTTTAPSSTAGKTVKFNKDSTNNSYKYNGTTGMYYINLSSAEAFAGWSNWIQKQSINGNAIDGLYYKLSQDLTRLPGYLVDANKNKYQLCTSYRTYTSPLDNYFVPVKLGSDAIYHNLSTNEDYKLTDNEYLLINYTESGNDSSSTQEVKKLYYGPGTVIQANFALIDSLTKHNSGTSWTKTGLNLADFTSANSSKIPDGADNNVNMLTLGTNEQIAIREPATVKLTDSITYIYWTLNSDTNSTDESASDSTTPLFSGSDTSYTLKDGEYFYYTDQNKLDFAFYGSGTKIIKVGNFNIPNKQSNASTESISEFGIDQIPWVLCNCNANNYIELKEYKYVNLTAGDELQSIITLQKDASSTTAKLTNDYYPLTVNQAEIKYKTNGVDSTLPKISITGESWEVRSKLEINCGPKLTQSLSSRDSIKLIDSDNLETITGPTLIQSNYSTIITDSEISLDESQQNDFKLRTLAEDTFGVYGKSKPKDDESAAWEDGCITELTQANIDTYWTKITCDDIATAGENNKNVVYEDKHISLAIDVPADHYGLLFIYYIKKQTVETTNDAYITYSGNQPELLNYGDTFETTKQSLKAGINIVKLKYVTSTDSEGKTSSSGKTELKIYPDKNNQDIIILGQFDLVDNSMNAGLNLTQIPYCKVDQATEAQQLLADIKSTDADHEFYYNCLLDNSTAIDFNDNLDEKESLITPAICYDYNNSNNKFVISEISDEDMRKGITIARTSKR